MGIMGKKIETIIMGYVGVALEEPGNVWGLQWSFVSRLRIPAEKRLGAVIAVRAYRCQIDRHC